MMVPLLEKHLGWVPQEDSPDGLVMHVARLDLLRDGAELAETALERTARKDRVDTAAL